MKIRVARSSDLEAIVRIYNQAITAEATAHVNPVTVEGTRDWFEQHLGERSPILVVEIDDGIVGWSSLSEYRPGRRALRHTAEISYYVDAAHRREGVGSALIRTSIERCPALSIKTLFAILLDDNVPSIHLVEGLGFKKWGHLPRVADFDGREVGHLYYGLRID